MSWGRFRVVVAQLAWRTSRQDLHKKLAGPRKVMLEKKGGLVSISNSIEKSLYDFTP